MTQDEMDLMRNDLVNQLNMGTMFRAERSEDEGNVILIESGITYGDDNMFALTIDLM